MELGNYRPPEKRRRRCLYLSVAAVLLVIVVVVVLALTLCQKNGDLKRTFIDRCEKYPGYDCQKLWVAFEQAYIGRHPCEVPIVAYDPLFAEAPVKPACDKMMFWSKTKDVAHDFTDKRDCFLTLEDTLLGSVLDDLTWCGEQGSSETFTENCPRCENSPVNSFWKGASAAFADIACGDVTVILNGSIATPFCPDSIFASIEVKRFNSTRMRSLNVVLVTQKDAGKLGTGKSCTQFLKTNCTNPSLRRLQEELDDGIKYNCTEVAEAELQECSSHPEIPCDDCW